MKKLLYIFFLLTAAVKINYAQSVYIKVGDWGVATANLLNGKIKYESTSGETPFSTSATFQRYEASTQVRVQAIYVFEANGSQVNISDSIFVNTADFTNPYVSKAFIKTATLKPNNKNGIVRLKWRYFDNYSGGSQWSGFQYASKTYGTINTSSVTPPGTVPVYSYYSQEGNDHYSTTAETIGGLGSYWKKDGINFYAFNHQAPGTVPIYSYINPNTPDHFSSRFVMTDPYWTLEGIGFYAYDTPGEKRAPVYSYINKDKSDHFISPDPNVASSYWINEGIAFYSPVN